ncbi:MAG: Accessory gene regulator protein B [Eubacteriales bacterium SKADARSKE-1]|nr:Accessory gene regulator protein B [Eubacteriales bacterium SKADARSKE-1]
MLNQVSKKMSHFLRKEGIIEEKLIDVYTYGFELILSSFLAVSVVLFIGFFLHCLIESILFLTCIITLRLHTGGYHANTYVGCNTLLIASFLLCIYAYAIMGSFKIFWSVQIILMLINFIIVFVFLPIENKPLRKSEKSKYKKISLAMLFLYYIIMLFLEINNIKLGFFIFIVLELIFGTIIFELIRRRLVKNEKLFIKN